MMTQLKIAACDTNISLRYTFRVPVYGGKKGDKLTGFKLVRIIMGNLVAKKDLFETFGGDVNKIAQMFMDEATKKTGIQETYRVEFRGIDVCEHRPMTTPTDDDPRWV